MKGYTFEFDISKVMFDEQYKSDEYETVRVTDNNSVEDYDWYDIVLLPTEIEQLMDLAMKALREEAETRVLAKEEKA